MKITLPPPPDGATWDVYQVRPVLNPQPDTRSKTDKARYWLLMRIHDWAESIWHWAYNKLQAYAPPQPQRAGSYSLVEDEVWGMTGNQESRR